MVQRTGMDPVPLYLSCLLRGLCLVTPHFFNRLQYPVFLPEFMRVGVVESGVG